eukprot:831586_1
MNQSCFYPSTYPLKIYDLGCKRSDATAADVIGCKTIHSSLPWKDRAEVIIKGHFTPAHVPNPNILNILHQINPTSLELAGSIPEQRLISYPYASFANVTCLCINDLNSINHTWLNPQHFPALKILKMEIPLNMTSHQLNMEAGIYEYHHPRYNCCV